jgi:hypothetical protein
MEKHEEAAWGSVTLGQSNAVNFNIDGPAKYIILAAVGDRCLWLHKMQLNNDIP